MNKKIEHEIRKYYIADAIKYGDKGAVLLYYIKYWVRRNEIKKSEKHFHEGRYWTFNSIPDWHIEFPEYSEDSLVYQLNELEKKGAIITGHFNKMRRDRTKWYTPTDGTVIISEAGKVDNNENNNSGEQS